ncbi:hypothetical protein ACFQX6_18065 [Streptosporangium lutulentum]
MKKHTITALWEEIPDDADDRVLVRGGFRVYLCLCGTQLADRAAAELHAAETNQCTTCLGSTVENILPSFSQPCTACAGTGRRKAQLTWELAYVEAETAIPVEIVRKVIAGFTEPFRLSQVADTVRDLLGLPVGRCPWARASVTSCDGSKRTASSCWSPPRTSCSAAPPSCSTATPTGSTPPTERGREILPQDGNHDDPPGSRKPTVDVGVEAECQRIAHRLLRLIEAPHLRMRRTPQSRPLNLQRPPALGPLGRDPKLVHSPSPSSSSEIQVAQALSHPDHRRMVGAVQTAEIVEQIGECTARGFDIARTFLQFADLPSQFQSPRVILRIDVQLVGEQVVHQTERQTAVPDMCVACGFLHTALEDPLIMRVILLR